MFREHARPSLWSSTKLLAVFTLLYALTACEQTEKNAPQTHNQAESSSRNRSAQPASTKVPSDHPAWPLGKQMLAESATKVSDLNAAINRLLDAPAIDTLEQAQRAWREAASAIERFHLFSRLGTVAPQDFYPLVDLQFKLAAWPVQPGYLDGVDDHPYSGIVFDIGVPVTAEVLREQHGMTDSSDATLGLYAIEFLLFGEHNERGPLIFRPITALNDKHLEDGYGTIEELPRNRRRELLRLQAQLLTEDVAHLLNAWSTNGPDSVQLKFALLTPTQQAELLQKAALALTTEQLVVIANQRGAELWQGQQLADRLAAQLDGLARFNAQVNLGDRVAAAAAQTIASLNNIRGLPPIDNAGAAPRLNWQDPYADMRELIKALNPAPADAVPLFEQETGDAAKAVMEP